VLPPVRGFRALLSILACLRAREVSCRSNRAGVLPDSAGIPCEDGLTAEGRRGLTTLFWAHVAPRFLQSDGAAGRQ
jgi:hypothetical protein